MKNEKLNFTNLLPLVLEKEHWRICQTVLKLHESKIYIWEGRFMLDVKLRRGGGGGGERR